MVSLPRSALTQFCVDNHVQRLALFGSALTDRFRPDSDIDLLVEFDAGHVPGLGIVRMQRTLEELLGRTVDLRTPAELSPRFRDQVRQSARILYERT